MSEIRSADRERPEDRWVMLAVAREADVAESWQAALEDEGIEAEVRLEDAVITGRSTATTYANGPSVDQLFAYAVWVPATDREQAAAILIDEGWDGQYGERDSGASMTTSYVVKGTLVALAAAALFVTILLRAGAG